MAVAVFAGVVTYLRLSEQPRIVAADFTWHWRAARVMLDGFNPYDVIQPTGPYPFNYRYLYPLTAAVLALPVAWMSPVAAAVVFICTSTFVLGYVATKHDYHRLPMFFSTPFVWACYNVQVTPLLTAALIAPAISGVVCAKPNLGLTVLGYRPRFKYAIIGATVLLAIAFAFVPSWPTDWIAAVGTREPGFYRSPVTLFGGPILLLAAFRWRQPGARLLLMMALIPQNFTFSDQLALWLVAETYEESLILMMMSFLGPVSAMVFMPPHADNLAAMSVFGPTQLLICYVPCLVMVLRRPNTGEVPRWLETLERRIQMRRATESPR